MDGEQSTQTQQVDTSTASNQQSNAEQTSTSAVDYDKIESMINKGAERKENAILKSYFEQQGMTGDEMTQAINDFKASRQAKAEERQNAYANMEAENKQLKAQIMQNSINNTASKVAAQLGIDSKNVNYVLKLADMSKAVNEKGEIAEDVIKAELEQVIKDIPALKGTQQQAGGFRIGAGNETGDATVSDQDKLRKMFGLK